MIGQWLMQSQKDKAYEGDGIGLTRAIQSALHVNSPDSSDNKFKRARQPLARWKN